MKVFIVHKRSFLSGKENDFVSVYKEIRTAQMSLVWDLYQDLQYFGADSIEADVDLSRYDIPSLAEGFGEPFDFPAKEVYLWKGDKSSPTEYIRYEITEHELN